MSSGRPGTADTRCGTAFERAPNHTRDDPKGAVMDPNTAPQPLPSAYGSPWVQPPALSPPAVAYPAPPAAFHYQPGASYPPGPGAMAPAFQPNPAYPGYIPAKAR